MEATDARIIRLIELAREIAADCETDALALDSTPFTPRGMGETFGQTLAMLGALAKVVAALADRVGALPPAFVPSPPEPAPTRPPDSFWREVPCGHPQDPVAWRAPDGHFVCHCAWGLDAADALSDGAGEGAPSPIVPCGKCGCYVALPGEQSSPGQTG